MVKIDVLTFCSGYEFPIFDRFVGTLNDTGFSGTIHLVIRPEDTQTIQLLKRKYTNVCEHVDTSVQKTHINCHRFFAFFNYLKKTVLDCEYILVCDARDVLFQKNFETYEYDPSIDIYGFTEGKTIGDEQAFNAPWIRQIEHLTKEVIYEKVKNKLIICCGTTIGKLEAMKQYIHQMCFLILKHNVKHNLDQGFHNYMLYMNTLKMNIRLSSNKDNLVNTLCNDVKKLDEANNIVNEKNEISYIVHQYDRCSTEQKRLLNTRFANKYDFLL